MSPTETDLREAMTRETEQLSITFPIDEIRRRARQARLARLARAAVATVILTALATVAMPALSTAPGRRPTQPVPYLGLTAAPSRHGTGTRADPIRTGQITPDRTELVLWLESGYLILGTRDPITGQTAPLATTSDDHFDWVRAHPLFGNDFLIVDTLAGGELAVGQFDEPVARLTQTRAGRTLDAPLVRIAATWVYWIPVGGNGDLAHLTAYAADGTVLDSLP